MPDFSFTPFAEGQLITAADVQAKFDNMRAVVNDLPGYSIRRNALGRQHVPSLIPTPGAAFIPHDPATISYTNNYPTYAVLDPGANPLQLTFTQISLGMGAAAEVAGVLVLMNVHFIGAYDPAVAASLDDTEGVFAIQYQAVTAGAWTTLSRTQRFIKNFYLGAGGGVDKDTFQDVAIATLITVADTATLAGVRGVVAQYNPSVHAGARVQAKQANLTHIAFHAQEPP